MSSVMSLNERLEALFTSDPEAMRDQTGIFEAAREEIGRAHV